MSEFAEGRGGRGGRQSQDQGNLNAGQIFADGNRGGRGEKDRDRDRNPPTNNPERQPRGPQVDFTPPRVQPRDNNPPRVQPRDNNPPRVQPREQFPSFPTVQPGPTQEVRPRVQPGKEVDGPPPQTNPDLRPRVQPGQKEQFPSFPGVGPRRDNTPTVTPQDNTPRVQPRTSPPNVDLRFPDLNVRPKPRTTQPETRPQPGFNPSDLLNPSTPPQTRVDVPSRPGQQRPNDRRPNSPPQQELVVTPLNIDSVPPNLRPTTPVDSRTPQRQRPNNVTNIVNDLLNPGMQYRPNPATQIYPSDYNTPGTYYPQGPQNRPGTSNIGKSILGTVVRDIIDPGSAYAPPGMLRPGQVDGQSVLGVLAQDLIDPNAASNRYRPGYGPGYRPGYGPGYAPGYGPGFEPGYAPPGYAPGYAPGGAYYPPPGGYRPGVYAPRGGNPLVGALINNVVRDVLGGGRDCGPGGYQPGCDPRLQQPPYIENQGIYPDMPYNGGQRFGPGGGGLRNLIRDIRSNPQALEGIVNNIGRNNPELVEGIVNQAARAMLGDNAQFNFDMRRGQIDLATDFAQLYDKVSEQKGGPQDPEIRRVLAGLNSVSINPDQAVFQWNGQQEIALKDGPVKGMKLVLGAEGQPTSFNIDTTDTKLSIFNLNGLQTVDPSGRAIRVHGVEIDTTDPANPKGVLTIDNPIPREMSPKDMPYPPQVGVPIEFNKPEQKQVAESLPGVIRSLHASRTAIKNGDYLALKDTVSTQDFMKLFSALNAPKPVGPGPIDQVPPPQPGIRPNLPPQPEVRIDTPPQPGPLETPPQPGSSPTDTVTPPQEVAPAVAPSSVRANRGAGDLDYGGLLDGLLPQTTPTAPRETTPQTVPQETPPAQVPQAELPATPSTDKPYRPSVRPGSYRSIFMDMAAAERRNNPQPSTPADTTTPAPAKTKTEATVAPTVTPRVETPITPAVETPVTPTVEVPATPPPTVKPSSESAGFKPGQRRTSNDILRASGITVEAAGQTGPEKLFSIVFADADPNGPLASTFRQKLTDTQFRKDLGTVSSTINRFDVDKQNRSITLGMDFAKIYDVAAADAPKKSPETRAFLSNLQSTTITPERITMKMNGPTMLPSDKQGIEKTDLVFGVVNNETTFDIKTTDTSVNVKISGLQAEVAALGGKRLNVHEVVIDTSSGKPVVTAIVDNPFQQPPTPPKPGDPPWPKTWAKTIDLGETPEEKAQIEARLPGTIKSLHAMRQGATEGKMAQRIGNMTKEDIIALLRFQ